MSGALLTGGTAVRLFWGAQPPSTCQNRFLPARRTVSRVTIAKSRQQVKSQAAPPSTSTGAAHHSPEPGKGFVPEGRSRCLPPSPPGSALFSGAAALSRQLPTPHGRHGSPPAGSDLSTGVNPSLEGEGGRKGGSIHTGRLLAPAPDPFASLAPGISRPFRFTGKILFRVFNTEI